MPATASYPVETAYVDVEKLIYHTVHAFQRRYGGDFDDLLSQANEHFMYAFNKWDSSRGKFSQRVRFVIWTELMQTRNRDIHRRMKLPKADLDEKFFVQKNRFHLPNLFKELSDDARTVLSLIFESPLKVRKRRGDWIRKSLYRELQQAGWCAVRIGETFNEIRDALYS